MINVLEQVAIQPGIIVIRSFSVDQAKALCKIISIREENLIWHPRFFFTRLRNQSQVRELYGYRILNVKHVPRSILLFQGFTNAQNSYTGTLDQFNMAPSKVSGLTFRGNIVSHENSTLLSVATLVSAAAGID